MTSTKATKVKRQHVTRKRKPRKKQPPMTGNSVVAAVAKLVSAEVLSEQTGIPIRTLYVMCRNGLLPVYRTGAEQYALRFNVEEVLTALRVAPKTELMSEAMKVAAGDE